MIYAGCALVFVGLLGSAYLFKNSFLQSNLPPVVAQVQKLDLPPGAIFIPAGDGICRMHALDNTTGHIMDYGIVKCSNASNNNSEVWRRATSKDRFIEIGKSFRHEDSN